MYVYVCVYVYMCICALDAGEARCVGSELDAEDEPDTHAGQLVRGPTCAVNISLSVSLSFCLFVFLSLSLFRLCITLHEVM